MGVAPFDLADTYLVGIFVWLGFGVFYIDMSVNQKHSAALQGQRYKMPISFAVLPNSLIGYSIEGVNVL